MNDDPFAPARGIMYGLLLAIAVWLTIAFFVLAVVNGGWGWAALTLTGVCAIGVLLETRH